MHSVSVREWELLSLFEVEPELRDPGEAWESNDAAYRVVQGDLSLSFAIAPFYRDVRIILEQGHHRVYELNAIGVRDVQYKAEEGAELLNILLTDREQIVLRVKPRIVLEHSFAAAE